VTEHPLDQLEAFALGDLDPAAAQTVLEHADRCPVCAPVLADAMTGVAAIAMADGTRDAAVSRIAPRRDRFAYVAGWWAAAATAAVVVLAVLNFQPRSHATQAPVVAMVPVAALVHSHFTHHPLHGTGGDAKELQALDGSWVYFVADGLQPGATYDASINGALLGSAEASPTGTLTSYWVRRSGKITSAQLRGPGGTVLRWP
jgi:hypothetical protein